MIVIILLLSLAGIIYYLVERVKQKFRYWEEKGVAQLKNQHLIYGDCKKYVTKQIEKGQLAESFYYYFKNKRVKHGGYYMFSRPVWMAIDPSIIKLVITKDFPHFNAHHHKFSNTLLFNNMFHMSGEPWKDIRRKLSPTFTSGKMKMMYDILLEKTNGLVDLVGRNIKSGETTELKELLARYTTDVIGSCAFGIECDSLINPDSVFFQKGQDIFRSFISSKPPSLLKLILLALGLVKPTNLDLSEIEDFFRDVVKNTLEYREKNKIVRRDFFHLLIQLKNRGTISDIVNDKDVFEKTDKDGLSMEDFAGQCMLFFTAGFETSSTTMSFALLEIAKNFEVQNKLRKEIRDILKKHNGVLSYDALQEMTYCDTIIQETLRKYPPLASLPRLCTMDYKLPDEDVTIKKGTQVDIPIYAIQNDPEYFPQPEEFIPERFSAENKGKIVEYTYMPFGEGPRMCLGLRFGLMQSKAGIVTLINRFKFSVDKRISFPLKFSPTSPILSVDGGIWLNAQEAE